MTKAIDRSLRKEENHGGISSHLKDEYGSIADHLRSHVHLTNYIHLKNQLYYHSPNMAERSLMRDLIVLQRSRSLRDPSTSPPSWVSPSIVGSFARRATQDGSLHGGRRSICVDPTMEAGRLSVSSPVGGGAPASKDADIEARKDSSVEPKHTDAVLSKNEEISAKNLDNMHELQKSSKHSPENAHRINKKSKKSVHRKAARLKTFPEQLEEAPNQSDSDNNFPSRLGRKDRDVNEEEEYKGSKGSTHEHFDSPIRKKMYNVKNVKRSYRSSDLRGFVARTSLISASNSISGSSKHNEFDERQDKNTELEGGHSPTNVCGVPWNWSRIHHRSKTFFDKAGKSLSCGLSDSKVRKFGGSLSQREGNASNIVFASDNLTSFTSSDSEALPLLIEPSGSEDNGTSRFLSDDYLGELGIFSNYSLSHERDSDIASEARSNNQWKSRGHYRGRHRSLTQKYMPKTFKDLVGQNLVVQALSNTILRKRVGLIYIFYGPHGTGKTSCARVFAKALNCQSVDRPRPCDACNSCILHNLGKSGDVLEVGTVANSDLGSVMDVLKNMMLSTRLSQYKVLIVDDCESLPPNFWGAISKIIDRAPRNVIFIFVSSSVDHFPHIIISRCQKFFFPKLKDSDILATLNWISNSEGLEVDKDALKLIASRADGSLRDAEMTLDQLSLLGQRVSISLFQELAGLVSDDKLVDLLDFALSADTINTVKNLREIMESGVEPLVLMSQLATVITDILAGSYVFIREGRRRRFFRQPSLSKEAMERLRQALKTLSEAEKQLRQSNDKLTWLTAALLQLAPDQQYVLPNSSSDKSLAQSPVLLHNISSRGATWSTINEQDEIRIGNRSSRGPGVGSSIQNANEMYGVRRHKDIKNLWQAVLQNIHPEALRHFLYSEGKLISVNLGAAPTVQIAFNSSGSKSRAERFRAEILQAFEFALDSPVTLEIRCEPRNMVRPDLQDSPVLPASENGSLATTKWKPTSNQRSTHSDHQIPRKSRKKENTAEEIGFGHSRWLHAGPHIMTEGEIIETGDLRENIGHIDQNSDHLRSNKKGLESVCVEEGSSSQHQHNFDAFSKTKVSEEENRMKKLVKGKISLAHVIQHAEGPSQRGGWSQRKAMSIAEKLEQQNLKLEPKSRSLFHWRSSRRRGKLLKLRIRSKRPRSLMKLVACGRCLSVKSPKVDC